MAGSHGISGLSIQNSNGAAVSIYTENREKRRMDKRVMDRPQRKEQKSVVEQRGTGIKNSRKTTEIVKRPKALGDIRGISYIYPILWRLGLIRVPEKFEEKMACDDEKNAKG